MIGIKSDYFIHGTIQSILESKSRSEKPRTTPEKFILEIEFPRPGEKFSLTHLRYFVMAHFIKRSLYRQGHVDLRFSAFINLWTPDTGRLLHAFEKYGNLKDLSYRPVDHLHEILNLQKQDFPKDVPFADYLLRLYHRDPQTTESWKKIWFHFSDFILSEISAFTTDPCGFLECLEFESVNTESVDALEQQLKDRLQIKMTEHKEYLDLNEESGSSLCIFHLLADGLRIPTRYLSDLLISQTDAIYRIRSTSYQSILDTLNFIMGKMDGSFPKQRHILVGDLATTDDPLLPPCKWIEAAKSHYRKLSKDPEELCVLDPEEIVSRISISSIALPIFLFRPQSRNVVTFAHSSWNAGVSVQYCYARLSG